MDVNKNVRLFVERRARAIGLVEGATSFTLLRSKSMQYGSLNFAVFFFFLKRNHLVLFEFKDERQPFCHKVKFVFTFSLSVRPSVHSCKDSVIAHKSVL